MMMSEFLPWPLWLLYVIMMKGGNMTQSHSHHEKSTSNKYWKWLFNSSPIYFHFFKTGSNLENITVIFSYPSTLVKQTDQTIQMQTEYEPYSCVHSISPSTWLKTSKRTCFSMMERSPTVATSAATQPSKLLIWKITCWFTVERSRFFANSATIPAHKLVTSRNTW